MRVFCQFNKILTKKCCLILLAVFIFSGLFLFSHQAKAFFDVIPALASMGLDALDFLDRIFASFFYILILAVGGGFFIQFSAIFLDWASSIPVSLSNNLLVNTGWGFLSGLVNMVFILIFLAIALSFILKTDTWGMKKALPRLIIIAFLLNFSLVFVKIFVDIGWLVQNSFKEAFFGSAGLAAPIALQINTTLVNVVQGYIANYVTPYYLLALIPFANVARIIYFGAIMLGEGPFLGTLCQTVLLVVFSLVGGLVFLVYAILFLVRIAAIWLLAIAAPLAFAAYILPQTQKLFQEWLRNLFQWVFLGIVVFFLMGLGLKFFSAVAPSTNFVVGNSFNFIAEFPKFIFLIIYMIFSLICARKFTPSAASAIWSFGEMALGRGTKWAGGLAGKLATNAPEPAYVNRAELAARRWAEGIPFVGRALGGPGATGARLSRDRAKIAEEFKGRGSADIRAAISVPALTPRDRLKRAAGLQMLAEMGALNPDDERFLPDAQAYGANTSTIIGRMPSWASNLRVGVGGITAADTNIANRVVRIASNKARDIQHQALDGAGATARHVAAQNVVRALSAAQLQDITRAGTGQQKQNILNTIRQLDPAVVGVGGRLRHTLGSGPRPSGLDRSAIRYISEQQAAGTWPNL